MQTLDRREALGVGAIHAYLSARPFFAGRQGLLACGLVLMSLSVVVSVAGGWRWWMAILPSVVLAFQIAAYVWLHREAVEGYRLVKDKIPRRYLAAAVRNRALLDRIFPEQLFRGGRGSAGG
ncbi:CHASE2 domain-containing sensor protein [Pseudomonas oryzihabitans]